MSDDKNDEMGREELKEPVEREPTLQEYSVSFAQQNYMPITTSLNMVRDVAHNNAVRGGWWHDLKTGEPLQRNSGELLCLMHSEISEAMEGNRKGLMDKHLPHRANEEVELADLIIRVMDYAGANGFDIGGAVSEKLAYNQLRADHKPEERLKEGGKKY